jgi:hypothetical protein
VRGRDLELLDIVQFVELDDGRRVRTTEQSLLSVAVDSKLDELRERVRELVHTGGDRYKSVGSSCPKPTGQEALCATASGESASVATGSPAAPRYCMEVGP